MNTFQASRRSTRRRVLAAGALSAFVGMAYMDSALASHATACAVNTFTTDGQHDCTPCPAGTAAAAAPTAGTASFCESVAVGYYGIPGTATGSHARDLSGGDCDPATGANCPTKCSTTFSGATAAGITSAAVAAGGAATDKTACETAAGYIITSAAGVADSAITVAQAAAGKFAAGGTALFAGTGATTTQAAETASDCAAGTYSAAGAGACTNCAIGEYSAAGATSCSACPAGTTSAAAGSAFCESVAVGYYGTGSAGAASAHATDGGGSACVPATGANCPTKCSTTFSGATAAGITSAGAAATVVTDKTACVTAAGYRITSAAGVADSAITVAQAAAGKWITGGTALFAGTGATTTQAAETATDCADGTYSAVVGASAISTCTACPTGFTTNGATGSTTRQTCQKSISFTDAPSRDIFVASTANSAAGALVMYACPEGTVAAEAITAASGTGSNIASKCGHIKAGFSGTVASGAHATVAECAADTYATGIASETRSACTACPTGFTTNGATGSTTRQTCQKSIASTDAASRDIFVASTANSVAGALVMYACPEGTVAAEAITAAADTGSNAATKCENVKENYYGSPGSGAHATPVYACPANSVSHENSESFEQCRCSANYKPNAQNDGCEPCASGTVRTGTVFISNTNAPECVAPVSTAAASTPTADSAGAAMPIAAAVAAMAMPLLI